MFSTLTKATVFSVRGWALMVFHNEKGESGQSLTSVFRASRPWGRNNRTTITRMMAKASR